MIILRSFQQRSQVHVQLSCIRLFADKNLPDFVNDGILSTVKLENIRNFSIIAHIDHGKSTLADCILQRTGNISADERKRGQVLDSLQVERERGITVKAQTASMIYIDKRKADDDNVFLLNMVDTPGALSF
jgi:GTP-binding protein LepA